MFGKHISFLVVFLSAILLASPVLAATIAVDLAHGEGSSGLSQMIPAMKQYQWAYFGSLGQLPSNLSVKNLGSTITANALKGVDVLILGQPTRPFTSEEIQAIKTWLQEGGKVLWVAGSSDYGNGVKTQSIVDDLLNQLSMANLRVDLCSVSDPVSNAGAGYRVVAYDEPDNGAPYRSILMKNLRHDGKVLFDAPGPIAWVDNGTWHALTGPVPDLHIYRIVVTSEHAMIVENNIPLAHVYMAGSTGVYTLMAAQIIKLSNGRYDVLIVSGGTPYGDYQPIWTEEYHGVQLDGRQFIENVINWSLTVTQRGINVSQSFGSLSITSKPTGAEVYVDGSYIGITPLVNYSVPTGKHVVTVRMKGYRTYRTTINVSSGATISLNVTLQPILVNLTIVSQPSGAKVYINGTYRGITPLNISLTPGNYTLMVSKKGYANSTFPLNVTPGMYRIFKVNLLPNHGYLSVTSIPSGAKVFVNGKYVGTTPIKNYTVPTGNDRVTVSNFGYKTFSESVDVMPGEIYTLSVTLQPMPSRLTIVSQPSGARVYVDNLYVGRTPVTVKVNPGKHEVRVEKIGYESWEKNLTIGSNTSIKLSATLVKPHKTSSSTSTTSTKSSTSTSTTSSSSTSASSVASSSSSSASSPTRTTSSKKGICGPAAILALALLPLLFRRRR